MHQVQLHCTCIASVAAKVSDVATEAVRAAEYLYIGRVTEFRHGQNIGNVVRKNNNQRLAYLWNYGEHWGQLRSADAIVFTDNHDTQRGRVGFVVQP